MSHTKKQTTILLFAASSFRTLQMTNNRKTKYKLKQTYNTVMTVLKIISKMQFKGMPVYST